MPELSDLISKQNASSAEIETYLDALDPSDRITAIRSLARKQIAALYALSAGHRTLDMEFLVPTQVGAMREVVHYGKNSLGAFSHFAKVFVQPASPRNGEIWGYNRTSRLVQTCVGPGYFIARAHQVPGELLVDYLRIPPARPEGWPPLLDNSARLSYFVYHQTQDILRGVSKQVSVGRALKKGKELPAWFVLCRQD